MKYLQRLSQLLTLAALSLCAPGARAQDYPTRPIKLIVPVVAGGGADAVARMVTEKMSATLGSGPQTVQGQVREIGASADPVTRTFTVKLGLEKSDALPLGITLNVHAPQLAGSQSDVIKVPTSALRQEGQQTAVWVFDANTSTVTTQVVQVATAVGNDVVIAAGLKPGQQIVSAGVHVLSPGQKVTVYNPAVTTPPASK